MIRVFDFECPSCGAITEQIIADDTKTIPCPHCDSSANRIFSLSNTAPVDAPWISSVLEVVQKNTDKPWCNEFLKSPTRANLKKWMKGEGLRHRDPGEPAAPKVDREARKAKVKTEVLKAMKQREAISIG